MVAHRFAALLVVLAFLLSPSSAGGRIEIDDITYSVDERIADRRDGKDSYRIRICVHTLWSCVDEFVGDIVPGQPKGPVVFREADGSWNGNHLNFQVINSRNRISLQFDLLNEHTIFQQHDWQSYRNTADHLHVSFRHRYVCDDGFYGIRCDRRIAQPKVTSTEEIEADSLQILLIIGVAFVFLLAILFLLCIIFHRRRCQGNSEAVSQKACVSTTTSSSSLFVDDSENPIVAVQPDMDKVNEQFSAALFALLKGQEGVQQRDVDQLADKVANVSVEREDTKQEKKKNDSQE
ncbi:hypothetical protein QR680_016816 [Steinernema hermaphroditum]|uniref:Uncharacterized protein n=1 Tax=Steinernema hermaphroditum TaxID=289476 RepID=A0AA39HET5_9BILA|nr:hypothetical protein QR680_016816 [Steinernema hermaphroditum]